MSQRVLVRGFEKSGWITGLRILALLILAGALFLHFQKQPVAWALTVGGGLLWLIVDLTAWQGRRQRRWVEDLGSSFIVTDREGTRPYRDEQVQALSLVDQEKFAEGQLKSVDRRFTLWMDEGSPGVEMTYNVAVGAHDPLGEFRGRITEMLQRRADEDLNRGKHVEGEHWQLSRSALTVRRGAIADDYPFDELTALDIFDGHVCIWKRGQDEAAIKVPLGARNAHVLYLLLRQRLKPEEIDPRLPSGTGLGRVLFERKASPSTAVALALAAAMDGTLGLVFAVAGAKELIPVGLVMMGTSLPIALLAWHLRVASFRCQDYGVCKRTIAGVRRLRYTDVASFSYHSVRQYVNGAYTGTTFTFRFTPEPASDGKPITYSTSLQNADDELETLRNHISKVIAGRMADTLSEHGQVAWTANLRLLKDGIEYRPKAFVGRKEPKILPYGEVYNFDIQQGTFFLWAKNVDKPVAQEDMSAPNFFPGYFLLATIFSPQEEAKPAE